MNKQISPKPDLEKLERECPELYEYYQSRKNPKNKTILVRGLTEENVNAIATRLLALAEEKERYHNCLEDAHTTLINKDNKPDGEILELLSFPIGDELYGKSE